MPQRLQEESRAVEQDKDHQTISPNTRTIFTHRLEVGPAKTGMSRGDIMPVIAKLKNQNPDMDIVIINLNRREKEE